MVFIKDIAVLLGISEYEFQQVYCGGGTLYPTRSGVKIFISDLPQNIQRLWQQSQKSIGWLPEPTSEPIQKLKIIPVSPSEPKQKPFYATGLQNMGAEAYASASEHSRKIADKYLILFNECEGLNGNELKEYIADWNLKNPDFRTSYQRFKAALTAYKKDGICAILGKYGKNKGKTTVPDELFEYFRNLYLQEGRPSGQSCYNIVRGHAKKLGYDLSQLPTLSSFDRRLQSEISEQAIYTARHGAKAANRKYGFYIKRNYDNLLAGECWVSDHAQIDTAVTCKVDGREAIRYPWLTAWADFKSGRLLGLDVHIEPPNSDHVFTSFYRGAVKYGVPDHIYLDNGKDYRCKDFAGGRRTHKFEIDEKKTTAMTAALGITTTYALPYNAQAKIIERIFKQIKEWFSKHYIGYRGGNVVERPEEHNKIRASGKLMSFEEFEEALTAFINDVLTITPVQSGHREGQSPVEIWDKESPTAAEKGLLRRVSKEALKLFCCRSSSVVSIGRRGVHDSSTGVDYYDSWMEGQRGRKVYMRRDPQMPVEAFIFDAASHEYIGMGIWEEGAAAIAKSDGDREHLAYAMSLRNNAKKVQRILARPGVDIPFTEKISAMAEDAKLKLLETGHAVSEEPTNMPIMLTDMDRVINKKAEQQNEGLQDLSILGLEQYAPPRKKRVFTLESDLQEAAADDDPDALEILANRSRRAAI